MSANPGFAGQGRKRAILRILGFVLLAGGVVVAVKGGFTFADAFGTTDEGEPGFRGILLLTAGGFLAIFGLAFLNAGFLGAAARYGAGETMPVVKDSASYLTDGEGLLGVGRTTGPRDDSGAGPFCSTCGVRNDDGAKFCDSCGNAIA